MEAQLAEYRASKAKQQKAQSTTLVQRLFGRVTDAQPQRQPPEPVNSVSTSESKPTHILKTARPPHSSRQKYSTEVTSDIESSHKDWKYYLPLALKIILWFCLWKYFIEIGFGAVYFIVTCSYLMYRNTRTGPRERGRLSAYSVFNPNHERLDGTFTAEQFEKELRMGAGSVK